ncbi:hypothetical protein Hanom_Chr04g00325831 [Helianthus anomalus]
MYLDLLGIEIDDNTLIPGLAVTSSRARPLAGWYFNSRWQHRRSHLCNTPCSRMSKSRSKVDFCR